MTYIAIPNAIGFVLDESQQVVTWGKECPNPTIVAPITEKALQKLSEGAPAHWDSSLSKIVVGEVPPPLPVFIDPTEDENREIRDLAAKHEARHLRRTRYQALLDTQLELLCDHMALIAEPDSPGAKLVALIQTIKDEYPKLSAEETNRLEDLKTRFPQYLKNA